MKGDQRFGEKIMIIKDDSQVYYRLNFYSLGLPALFFNRGIVYPPRLDISVGWFAWRDGVPSSITPTKESSKHMSSGMSPRSCQAIKISEKELEVVELKVSDKILP